MISPFRVFFFAKLKPEFEERTSDNEEDVTENILRI
jgi:hypothetical protein